MSIETIGSSASLIKNNDAESWVKKNDLEVNKMLDYSDLKTGVNSYKDNSKTFSEFTIDVEYKEIQFNYTKCDLNVGHIKYFIVNLTSSISLFGSKSNLVKFSLPEV